METKIKASISLAIIVILLLVIIRFKIKSDKQRKSLEISSAEREKNIYIDKNEPQHDTIKPKGKKPYFAGIPSWGLALLTLSLALVFLMLGSDIFVTIFKVSERNSVDLVFYILHNILIAGGCFHICMQNPKSILYVPVLCNIMGIISAIVEPSFWKGSLWIVFCSGWVLSIVVSIIGAQMGKWKAISDNPQTF